jgi:ketosteroid isomerase-like protein
MLMSIKRALAASMTTLLIMHSVSASAADMTELQADSAAAYNRKDAEGMALAFTEDAIRVTPSGIFLGREAIRRNLEDVLRLGLSNYSVRQTVSREYGPFQLNGGEWEADFGSTHLRGYYTAIVISMDGSSKIAEETVTVAAP